jgi:crotonobetainyl-CoA:carnitine CoA-transferase CaiB-like acyl-CoA transferase
LLGATLGDEPFESAPGRVDGTLVYDGPEGWARSGAMELSGRPGGPPLLAPADLAGAMSGALSALAILASCGARRGLCGDSLAALDAPALLGERAALLGLTRRGSTSAGGRCRLLRAADGYVAMNLARESDRELLLVSLEIAGRPGDEEETWGLVESAVRARRRAALAAGAQLLGVPVAALPGTGDGDEQLEARRSFRRQIGSSSFASLETRPVAPRSGTPFVIDLSSLWAGPLAASLLIAAGCRVVKVESSNRPDTTREVSPVWYDLLHGGKESVVLDFSRPGALRALVAAADVVIESSRPRALEQLGVRPAPDQVWVSITGYGRNGPWRDRVAFGDDAAVAGGLVVHDSDRGEPLFCADAVADPLAGLHAAVACVAAIVAGCGGIVDVAMRDVVRFVLATLPLGERTVNPALVRTPRARAPRLSGPAFGADTEAVLAEL